MEGRCQLKQERRGSPTECGEKAVEMSVAQLSVVVDQLKDSVYEEDVMPSQDMSVAQLNVLYSVLVLFNFFN